MSEDELEKRSWFDRGVTIFHLFFTALGSAVLIGAMFFASWLAIHDEINSLKFQVNAFGSNTRVEKLEFDDAAGSTDRQALHKALDEFEVSSMNDRRDLRERIIRLEAKGR